MHSVKDDDARRLAALQAYGIVDTAPEGPFDELAFIASRVCQAPVALVSLVETERQWFKARVGLDASETPIEQSVCALGLGSTDLLIIPDLGEDDRTRSNSLVTDGPRIRFYAGAPLVTPEGVVIGMLCVIDLAPRPQGLTDVQQRMLRALAGQVISLLEMRKAVRRATAAAARHVSAEEAGNVGTFEAAIDSGALVVSPEFCRIFGLPVQPTYTSSFLETLIDAEDAAVRSSIDSRADGSADPIVEYRIRRKSDGAPRWVSRKAEFVRDETGRVTHMVGVVQDVTDQRMLNGEISHRLKNTLSLVQSIAAHTLRAVPDREPVREFDRRLMALGTAHDVLLQRTVPTAPVRAIVDAVVDTLGVKPRTSTHGPVVELSSQSTLMLAMLIHELATNSMKYGALSRPDGLNAIRWSLEDEGATFALDWIESGGPPATQPVKKGFGSRLIERGLGSRSTVTTRYDARGFAAGFRVALAAIA